MMPKCTRFTAALDNFLPFRPCLSPTARKVLRWAPLPFLLLSACAVGFSFFSSCPMSWKRILRIGGSGGVGVSSVALGILFWKRPNTRLEVNILTTEALYMSHDWYESGWKEHVEPALKQHKQWEGRLKCYLPSKSSQDFANSDNDPFSIDWVPLNANSRSEHYSFPVQITRKTTAEASLSEDRLVFTETEKNTANLPTSPCYSKEEAQRAIKKFFESKRNQ